MRCVTLRSRQMECLDSAYRCGIDVHRARACLRRLDDFDGDVNVVMMDEAVIKDLRSYEFLLERLLHDARVVRKFLIVKGVYAPDEVHHWLKSESIKVDAMIDGFVKAREQMYRFFKEYTTYVKTISYIDR